ncbi:hypothetical protein ARMSODRAFT_963774 [Armillaria solidipes]|uniref:Uncharacterized protein n=1 Tax=Armillaria solidipes TaxID=1076256 RepID=A0A2H3BEA4_9AGAR|nr:hypothetical protein ARMSODRAFT_963774 [Armillaria solidipes]
MDGQEVLTTGDQLVVGGHPLDAPTDVMNSYGDGFANGIADRAFIVLGDPGIGKTLFLYYLLIMRLIDGQPTALQIDRTDHFHVFDATGVYIVSHDFPLEEYVPKGTWALVDGNISIPGATNIFSQPHSPFFVVHACSPRPSLIEYAKKKARQTQYFILPFSWKEILLCRSLIRPPGVPTEIDISRWYDTFGPSARDCYNQTPHSAINHRCEISDLLSYVNWVACLQNYRPQSPRSASLDESRSQDLFLLILPRYHNPFSPAKVVITDHILSLFRVHHKRQFQVELQNAFELMYTHPRSRALLSHMFEDEVKLLLQKRVPRKVYSMKKGIKGTKNQVYHASETDRTWLFDLPPSPATFFYENLDDVFPVPGLYLPKDCNEKTLDSFTVSKDTDGSIVLSYQQCTVGMKHGVHAEPLKTASAWIKAGKISKFRYIAVLPGVTGHHTAFYFPLKAFDDIEVSTGVIFIDPEEMSERSRYT